MAKQSHMNMRLPISKYTCIFLGIRILSKRRHYAQAQDPGPPHRRVCSTGAYRCSLRSSLQALPEKSAERADITHSGAYREEEREARRRDR